MKAHEGVRRARSPWQLYLAFALAAVLLGCVTQSGPPLSSLATLGGPPRGMARIVAVRREKGYFGIDYAFPVKLDGEPLGELATGTFAYLDRPAGPHQLSSELWRSPAVTRRDFPGPHSRVGSALGHDCRRLIGGLLRLATQQARLPASEPGHARQFLPLQ